MAREINIHPDRQTMGGRQIERQVDGQTDEKAVSQRDRWTACLPACPLVACLSVYLTDADRQTDRGKKSDISRQTLATIRV